MGELGAIVPFVLIAVLFWLLIIRPASKRQKAVSQMQSSLEIGDDVMLTSGVYATVVDLLDDRAEVEIAPGTVITVARGAVGSVVPPQHDELDRSDRDPLAELDDPARRDPEDR